MLVARRIFDQLDPNVQAALKQIEKEEAVSNLNQARLGKRVTFNETSFFVKNNVFKEDYRDEVSGLITTEESIEFSEPRVSTSERLILKIAKQEFN